MNIETLIPIAMAIIGALIAYAVGFGVGRRSAYDDVAVNLGKPKNAGFPENSVAMKGWVVTQMFK